MKKSGKVTYLTSTGVKALVKAAVAFADLDAPTKAKGKKISNIN